MGIDVWGVVMIGISILSLCIVVRALQTGRVGMGRGVEADRGRSPLSYNLMLAVWSASSVGAMFIGLGRMAAAGA